MQTVVGLFPTYGERPCFSGYPARACTFIYLFIRIHAHLRVTYYFFPLFVVPYAIFRNITLGKWKDRDKTKKNLLREGCNGLLCGINFFIITSLILPPHLS
uniref:Uncharacterized protein n=1 Tax=Trypanosoma congolense (strain IL3000) TaxID=1068625 RepID=G0UKZ3_TRYCI|nr:hypothetical protein, unlikely [Trypanosoma congolense IL3000]